MDFTRFVALLGSGGLFFCRADRLGERFEGSFPMGNLVKREASWRSANAEEIAKRIAARRAWPRWAYISCWHMSEHESAAMWSIHGRGPESVAIHTTYERLVQVLPDHVFVGMVTYIDYATASFSENNTFRPLMHKRASYAFEHEVRAIESMPLPRLPNGEADLVTDNLDYGHVIPVDLPALMLEVRCHPESRPWFRELVANEVERYGFAVPVVTSDLDSDPLF